jgi:hypothetical protein
LISSDDEGLGEELQVIWELEPGAKVHEKMALPEPTGFDAPATVGVSSTALGFSTSVARRSRAISSAGETSDLTSLYTAAARITVSVRPTHLSKLRRW